MICIMENGMPRSKNKLQYISLLPNKRIPSWIAKYTWTMDTRISNMVFSYSGVLELWLLKYYAILIIRGKALRTVTGSVERGITVLMEPYHEKKKDISLYSYPTIWQFGSKKLHFLLSSREVERDNHLFSVYCIIIVIRCFISHISTVSRILRSTLY